VTAVISVFMGRYGDSRVPVGTADNPQEWDEVFGLTVEMGPRLQGHHGMGQQRVGPARCSVYV